jgi:hypothetical protein
VPNDLWIQDSSDSPKQLVQWIKALEIKKDSQESHLDVYLGPAGFRRVNGGLFREADPHEQVKKQRDDPFDPNGGGTMLKSVKTRGDRRENAQRVEVFSLRNDNGQKK